MNSNTLVVTGEISYEASLSDFYQEVRSYTCGDHHIKRGSMSEIVYVCYMGMWHEIDHIEIPVADRRKGKFVIGGRA